MAVRNGITVGWTIGFVNRGRRREQLDRGESGGSRSTIACSPEACQAMLRTQAA
jgi:hypothetical protein